MPNFKSFGPLGAELQAPPCPRNRTLLPLLIINNIDNQNLKSMTFVCVGYYSSFNNTIMLACVAK